MKTIFHDKESGTKLEMEGTFGNSKARLVDDEGNVLIESEGSYSEVLGMISKLSGEEDEQKNIQPDELFVVNNDEMEYCLGFEKGEIVKFLFHEEDDSLLVFRNSEGIDQAVEHEDVTLLENQEGNKTRFNFCYENDILLTEDTSLKGAKVNLTEHSVWIEDDESLVIHTDCDDGIPYIVSSKTGDGAFVDLSKLKLRTKEYTQSLEIGDYVKVKEGKECGGAKGFAIVTDIEGDNVRLKGIDENSYYRETWINSVDNVIKIG